MSKLAEAFEEMRDEQNELQIMQQPKPCRDDDGYAHPEDSVDRLGRLFATLRIRQKYGITFERYMQLVRLGEWENVAG